MYIYQVKHITNAITHIYILKITLLNELAITYKILPKL